MNEVPTVSKQRLYSLKQIAEILSFGVPTLRNLIYRGELSVVRTSARGKVRVTANEIERFITRNTARYTARPSK
jgi:excisionase family DNA binding protein